LFGDYGFSGKLGFSWPRNAVQIPIHADDLVYDPLYEYGFGLTY
jgi:beta-glucosidase